MNRSDAISAYIDFSARASENVRRLSYAAIAIIWIFRKDTPTTPIDLPDKLALVGALVVVTLLLDFLQYVYGTLAWGVYHRYKERQGIDLEEDFKAPAWINWLNTFVFFALKVLMIMSAYAVLLAFLWRRLFPLTQASGGS